MDEAFGVKGPGGLQGTSALSQHIRCPVMMDIIGGEHRDPGMAVLGVVPGEERPAEGDGGGNVFEAPRVGDWTDLSVSERRSTGPASEKYCVTQEVAS